MFLYKTIVLFKGIRVPERWGILLMLALSVLAGLGVVKILARLPKRTKTLLSAALALLLIYEFICVPLPSSEIPRKPSQIYSWLAADRGSYGILEYPFDTNQINKEYMYWSTFHWKKLANGSTGFIPKKFRKIDRLAHDREEFPNLEFLWNVREFFPVKYLILHLKDFSPEKREEILSNAAKYPKLLRLVKTFPEGDYVYEILY
jgi:hypothetical protein